MRFSEVINQAINLLQDSQRISYASLKREFDLDDTALTDLVEELIDARRVASDENGKVLVWRGEPQAGTGNTPPTDEKSSAGAVAEVPSREAERRQITVMFCDLVGSTALSEKLDAEDLLDIMSAYQRAAGAIIQRYEGHVAQYLGDGLMVYFGWPTANEHDAARAVRASFEIIEAVKDVAAPDPLQVRIGIATGPVVVAATGAGDPSVPQTAVGETPNVAARLQGLADPDEIVVSPTTRRLLGAAFEFADLGEQSLKGMLEPIRALRVVTERNAANFFAARAGGTLTPLVGRESELALLVERWEQSKDGEGQVVLLSGEPGIGKSRITQVFKDRLGDEPHIRLNYQCSPYYSNSALYPIIDQLEHAAGFARDDAAQTRLDKIETLLARGTENIAETAPLIASLLSLPVDRYPTVDLNPAQRKERTYEALAEQACALAAQNPVLMTFEDAHWIDPTTLELLNILVDQIQDKNVLLVITHRPEFVSPWLAFNHVTQHELNRLSRRQRAQMVAEVIGGGTLPTSVIDQIVTKTDGVPLFVEELTKAVLEGGVSRGPIYDSAVDSATAIPATLQDSLMARLDRLSSGKEIAQIGACIGRDFSHELLLAVTNVPDSELHTGLEQLISAELIFRRGVAPHNHYTFKHALIQDTAYQSLLKGSRQQLHARIAEVLEERFRESVDNEPELLARHYSAARNPEQAIRYWQKAGARAVQRSANPEAVENLRQGLALVPELPDEAERARRELALRAQLGPALIAVNGYGAPETADCYERARELLDVVDDVPELFPILYGCWVNTLTWAEFATARDMAQQFLARATQLNDTGAVLTGHRILGFSLSCLGEFAPARENFELLLALYKSEQHASLGYRYGQDPKAAGASMLGWNLWHLGYPDQAVRTCDEAVAYARDIQHTNTRGYVETFGAARIALFRGDRQAVQTYVDAMLALCEEQELVFWFGFIKTFQGWLLIEQQRYREAIDTIREGLDAHEKIGTYMFKPHGIALLSQAHAFNGNIDKGLELIDEAALIAERTAERWITPELQRLKGEIVLMAGGGSSEIASAETCFESSLAKARERNAKSWELRAATSLARLWQQQGNRREAGDMLSAVYGWFSEGFDTRDLQQAKATLDALQQ